MESSAAFRFASVGYCYRLSLSWGFRVTILGIHKGVWCTFFVCLLHVYVPVGMYACVCRYVKSMPNVLLSHSPSYLK